MPTDGPVLFTVFEVGAIVSGVVTLVIFFFGLRAQATSNKTETLVKIAEVKADTHKLKSFVMPIAVVEKKVGELHDWHDDRDTDGRHKWKNSSRFEDAVITIAESSRNMEKFVGEIAELMKIQIKEHVEIIEKLDDILAQE